MTSKLLQSDDMLEYVRHLVERDPEHSDVTEITLADHIEFDMVGSTLVASPKWQDGYYGCVIFDPELFAYACDFEGADGRPDTPGMVIFACHRLTHNAFVVAINLDNECFARIRSYNQEDEDW